MKKLFNIFSRSQKIDFILQLVLMFFGMILEIFSIGILFPIINLMQNGEKGILEFKHFINNRFSIYIGINDKSFITFIMIFLTITYLFKMFFLSFISYKQSKFYFKVNSDFAYHLYKNYLNQPYLFHLKNNSSLLINNTIYLPDRLQQGLSSFLILLTEIITLVGLIMLLIIVEPFGTLGVMSTLALLSGSFYYLTKNKTKKWGFYLQKHVRWRLQQLQQGLGGIKDVKIYGKEPFFLENFQSENVGIADYNQKQAFLMSLPKYWLETLAIFGLTLLIIIMNYTGSPISKIIPVLGLFAASTFRLIPSIIRILNALQTVGFTSDSLNKLDDEFKSFLRSENFKSSFPYVDTRFNQIILQDVTFSYPDSTVKALDLFNLKIDYGSTVGFIGTSGAGKSTLIDLFLGLLKPNSGKILVDDFDISLDISGWQKQIGYVPQNIFLLDDTLRNNIAFGIKNEEICEKKIKSALEYSQLSNLVESLPEGLDTIVGERGVRLSGGQRQRIGIARALYHNPKILVLDEATSSLDVRTESNIMDAVRLLKSDKTILIIAHRLNTIDQCDFICKIENGKLVSYSNNKK